MSSPLGEEDGEAEEDERDSAGDVDLGDDDAAAASSSCEPCAGMPVRR